MQKLKFNKTFESSFTVFSNPVYEGVVTLLLRVIMVRYKWKLLFAKRFD